MPRDGDRFIRWAESIGPATAITIKGILTFHKIQQQGYKSCMGLLKLADKYSVTRLENACVKALSFTPQPSYKSIKNILVTGQDMVVDVEYWSRHNNRLKRNIHQATFDQPHAALTDINYTAGRLLDRALIETLGTCEYIRERHNVIIMGATGSGKTYIGCALGMEACKQGFTVRYVRLPELLEELAITRGQGNFKKVLAQWKKADLLILDEWMLISLTETEARDLLEIIHARHKRASTIFCSQFAPAGWYSKFPEATIADAILDRIVHDSYTIEIRGADEHSQKSMREVYGVGSK